MTYYRIVYRTRTGEHVLIVSGLAQWTMPARAAIVSITAIP